MYKTIGIIGGMGPAATCDLMNKIISHTVAEKDQQHIPLLVDCNTRIPDRTAAILQTGEDPVPEMKKSALRLAAMGADFLIMPCNTAHYFYERLTAGLGIPLLHMPRESRKYLGEQKIKKAALLATEGTVASGVYDTAFADGEIELLYPDKEQQELVTELIYSYIKKGRTKADELPIQNVALLLDALKERGAEQIILGCTELPIAFALMGFTQNLTDPTLVLARAAIRYAGANVIEQDF